MRRAGGDVVTTIGVLRSPLWKGPMLRRASPITFVVEHHLGHRTYAANLREVVAGFDDVDARWVAVRYEADLGVLGVVPWEALRAALRGRREVLDGLRRSSRADVRVFNTQVPAALGGPRSLRSPYVLSTDVTPRQLDEIAAEYEHLADRRGPLRWAKHRLNRHVFGRASACAPWSQWTRRSLIAEYGVDPDRIHVIPPGVDLARWTPAGTTNDGPLKVLFVGGDFRRKGGDVLLAALDALPPGSADVHVVSKDSVPRRDGVHVYADLAPNDQRLIDLYRSSDVFALPSRAETFGIAAVEAAAAGLPAVVSDVGGLAELVIDSETGWRVPPGDPLALAAVLRRLIDDRSLARRCGAAARARAEREFDARRNGRRLVELALSCAANRTP